MKYTEFSKGFNCYDNADTCKFLVTLIPIYVIYQDFLFIDDHLITQNFLRYVQLQAQVSERFRE